jgi:peptidoglycan glycosyltransferase
VRRAALALLGGFLVVALTLGYWQAWRAPDLATDSANPRVAEASREAPRGRIVDRAGQVLAHSERTPQGMRRRYADPSLVHTLGFHSARFGATNLEARYDAQLRGERSPDVWERLLSELFHREARPDDLVLTIDKRIHEAAVAAMGDANGAIVALDPRTGAVLALVARPFFDPNLPDERLAALQDDPARPLFNRAVQATYVPGSTFKAVTAAVALDLGLIALDQPFTCTTPVRIGTYSIDCRNSQHVPRLTYREAFAWSSNRVFGLSGLLLGFPGPLNPWLSDEPPGPYPWERPGASVRESAARLEQYAERFGFARDIPFDLPVTPSALKRPDSEWTPQLLAQTAFGQGELAATPLQMALVAAAIANGGRVPEPYLAAEVRAPSGASARPHPQGLTPGFSQAMSAQTARTMVDFMVEGVVRGYASKAALPNVTVGGKTGTAEVGEGVPHSWFIGFAPADDPRVAVAVIGEHKGSGAEFATVAAQRVLRAALEVYRR